MSSELDSVFETSGSQSTNPEKGLLVHRYRDGYLVARATIAFATLIKGLGWIVAIITWIAAIGIGANQYGSAKAGVIFTGLMWGVIQLVVFHFLGVLLAAIGQVLRATLDTAVHSSPFLTDSEKETAVRG